MKQFKVGDVVMIDPIYINNIYKAHENGEQITDYEEFFVNCNPINNFKVKLVQIIDKGQGFFKHHEAEVKRFDFYKVQGDFNWVIPELFSDFHEKNKKEADPFDLDGPFFKAYKNLKSKEPVKDEKSIIDRNAFKFKLQAAKVMVKGNSSIVYGFAIANRKILYFDNGKMKVEDVFYNQDASDRSFICSLAKARIKDYNKSSDLFGYKPTKEEMFNSKSLFKIADVKLDFVAKKDNLPHDIVELNNGEINLKFLLEDIELVWPNLNGYSIAKNREVNKDNYLNKEVKFIRTKKLPVEKNDTGKIIKIWNDHQPVKGFSHKRYRAKWDKNSKIIVETNNKQIICKIKNIKLK